MYIVQIRGANGTGKTTIVKDLLALSNDKEHLMWEVNGKRQIVATACKDIEWVAIGNYPEEKPMGGCDNFRSMQDVKDAIHDAYLSYYQYFGIVFEGMMITAVKTPFYDLLLGMERDYHVKPVFVNLVANIDGCLERIDKRGTRKPGAKPINLELLDSKLDATRRYGKYFGKYSKWINVETTPRDMMLKKFLTKVGDWELANQL